MNDSLEAGGIVVESRNYTVFVRAPPQSKYVNQPMNIHTNPGAYIEEVCGGARSACRGGQRSALSVKEITKEEIISGKDSP